MFTVNKRPSLEAFDLAKTSFYIVANTHSTVLLHKAQMEFNDDVCPSKLIVMWAAAQGSVLDRLINFHHHARRSAARLGWPLAGLRSFNGEVNKTMILNKSNGFLMLRNRRESSLFREAQEPDECVCFWFPLSLSASPLFIFYSYSLPFEIKSRQQQRQVNENDFDEERSWESSERPARAEFQFKAFFDQSNARLRWVSAATTNATQNCSDIHERKKILNVLT